MVSDKVVVVLLICAILLSLVSTVVTLTMNFDSLKNLGRGTGQIIQFVPAASRESAGVGVVVEEAKP